MTWLTGLGVAVPLRRTLADRLETARRLTGLLERYPDAHLVRNAVGNVALVVPHADSTRTWLGWIDTLTGELELEDGIDD